MPNFDLNLGRHVGLTHVIDKGLGPRAWEDILDVAGDHISIVKLGWGTAYVTRNLERKLDVLRDKPVVIGGTFFEVVYAKGRLDDYKQWLADLGLDARRDLRRHRRDPARPQARADRRLRARLHRPLRGRVEGLERRVLASDEWTRWLNEELAAGAWKVITEAREGGTAGIFDSSGGMRTDLIKEIANAVGPANIVFEAPTKAAQAWFVKQFGPSVNLGNIPPDEVIPLETLRLGLRGDTLKEVLLGDQPTAAV